MSSLPPPPVNPPKGSRTRLVLLISLAVLLLVVLLLNLGKGTYRDYRLASAAVERFHQQLDAADYEGIYAEASDEFRQAGAHADEVKFLEMVHQKMGNSGQTSFAGFHVNWKNGRVWVDQVLNTQFALGRGQESFIWVMEQDRLRLYGYHIDSPNLR